MNTGRDPTHHRTITVVAPWFITSKRATCMYMVPGHVFVPELCCNSFPYSLARKGLVEDPDWQHMAQYIGHVMLTV